MKYSGPVSQAVTKRGPEMGRIPVCSKDER